MNDVAAALKLSKGGPLTPLSEQRRNFVRDHEPRHGIDSGARHRTCPRIVGAENASVP